MKTVVITGVSSGIGRATAEKFMAEGWNVIGTYHHTPVSAEDARFAQVQLDLASSESIATAAQQIRTATSQVDALINCAAVLVDYADVVTDVDRVRETLHINLLGTIDFTEKVLPLVAGGGHIVNISSNLGSFAHPIEEAGMAGYRMSKAALNMYTRVLAFRLREKGILVSSLDPGWVDTDMGRVGGDTPDRAPHQPAGDVYALVFAVTDTGESGNFWRFGSKRPW